LTATSDKAFRNADLAQGNNCNIQLTMMLARQLKW